MTMATNRTGRSLAQSLAIQSQIHLPGTVGRILNQIRGIEELAPLFVEAGLVKSVDRPNPLNLRVAGIATQSALTKTIGGFLYAAAASRFDLEVAQNVVSTIGQDSTCELDDINFEDQAKRLQLIGVRQAYEMADAALKSNQHFDLILMDCPLVLDRSMVPQQTERDTEFRRTFDQTMAAISAFWKNHRDKLLPWNAQGTVVIGLATKRYGAIVQIARQDLRSTQGRKQILTTEQIRSDKLQPLVNLETAISGIGERRFVYGILNAYTRTAAFQMNVQQPRMEPSEVISLGVVGLHFRAAQQTGPRLMQLIGNESNWTAKLLNRICGQVMSLMVVGGQEAAPLPMQLAEREQQGLRNWLEFYSQSIVTALKQREVEDIWLSDLDEDG